MSEALLTEILRDMSLYPRALVDERTVERLIDAIRSGVELPPLTVDQKNRLIDGFHRWEAYDRLDTERVQVRIIEVASDADFFKRAVEANSAHGRPFTAADYPRAIARAADLGLTPALIAEALHVPVVRLDALKRGIGESDGKAVRRGAVHESKPKVRWLAKELTNRLADGVEWDEDTWLVLEGLAKVLWSELEQHESTVSA